MPPHFDYVWSVQDLDLLISFCTTLQNHPQHSQFNSNHYYLMFYSDKLSPNVDS